MIDFLYISTSSFADRPQSVDTADVLGMQSIGRKLDNPDDHKTRGDDTFFRYPLAVDLDLGRSSSDAFRRHLRPIMTQSELRKSRTVFPSAAHSGFEGISKRTPVLALHRARASNVVSELGYIRGSRSRKDFYRPTISRSDCAVQHGTVDFWTTVLFSLAT